jgi:hypothetical protein
MKTKIKPPATWREAEVADKMARRAAGLDNSENVQQALLINLNESVDVWNQPIEADSVCEIEAAPLPSDPAT